MLQLLLHALGQAQVATQPHRLAHQVSGFLGGQEVAAVALPILLNCDILPLLDSIFTHASNCGLEGAVQVIGGIVGGG